jgi:hypothetical protein
MLIDTDKVVVLNWYDKETLEVILDEALSEEKYQAFRKFVAEDSGLGEATHDILMDEWDSFLGTQPVSPTIPGERFESTVEQAVDLLLDEKRG